MLDSNDNGRSAFKSVPSVLSAMLRASDGILDLLPIATYICDARGTILQYNQRAVEIWGRAPAPGQTHDQFSESSQFFAPDGTPMPRSLLSEVLAHGKPVRDVERLVVRGDGTRSFFSVNIDPLRNTKGELVGAVNCFLDITERKLMNEALEQSRLLALEREQFLAATYEHAAIGISEISPEGNFLRVNEAICAISGYSREEHLTLNLFHHNHPEDTDPDREGFRKQVAGDLEFYSIENELSAETAA